MIISFLNPPTEGEIPGKLCITFVISLFPPGYVSISTAENVWVDKGVSIEVLKGDWETITSSKIWDDGFNKYSMGWLPADFIITLYFVSDLNPIKLAVTL